jgi:hypothetical protein
VSDEEASNADPLAKANEQIRDAAKWLIGSAAAVAAALIAGSQLSSIGKLDVGWPKSVETLRLWVAVLGAIGGLVAIVYILWTAVQLLTQVHVTLRDLVDEWDKPSRRLSPAVKFLKARPKYLQGFKSPQELEAQRTSAVEELERLDDAARISELQNDIADLDRRIAATENRASNCVLQGMFSAALKKLMWATAVAAFGILSFAWAANPAEPPAPAARLVNARLVDADMRDANLVNAELDQADLSGADLTGADLTGASITGVNWKGATCPDGRLSDEVGGSCAGHLAK